MPKTYIIRETALKLLDYIYKNIDTSLSVRELKYDSLIDESTDKNTLIMAFKYLLSKKYVSTISSNKMYPDPLSCTITGDGIDYLETYMSK